MAKRRLLIATPALLLANFMGGLDSTVVNTALPAIISDLHGIRLIGWVSAIFLLGVALTTVFWGRIGESLGNKRTFQLATALFIVSSVVGGFSPNMLVLILARAVMGIGAGGMVSIPFIIYADMYANPAERARAIGWVIASYTLSTVVGPIIGGWIVDNLSWHWVFFINLTIGLAAMVMLQLAYRETTKRQNRPFDFLGMIVLSLALMVLLFAGDALADSGLRAGLLFIIGLILIGVFWRVEAHSKVALVPVSLLKDWRIQSQNVLMFLINGFFIGFSVYAPMWAQGILGTSATLGGMTQIAGSLLLLVGTRVTANLMPWMSYKRIVMIGIISVLISAIAMFLATKSAPYWWLIVSGAFEGFGMGLSFTPMQVSIQDGVAPELISVSTTFGLLFRTLGETLFASVYGALLSLSTASQVMKTGGRITAGMIDKLTDAQSAAGLPSSLLPEMRAILHSGLHLIMTVGLILVVLAVVVNVTRRPPMKQPR